MAHWQLGTIGYSYKEWVGEFYPKGTSPRDYLAYYCKVFNSVELDTTFHSIPQASTVASWAANSPDDFLFCVKTPHEITHEMGLAGSEGLMEQFLESLLPLRGKLGPILIQLPPSFTQEKYPVLNDFLNHLTPTFRYAIEFRHSSWFNVKTEQLLSQHQVGWVSIDFPNLPKRVNCTTDFLYFRWIGVNGRYQRHSFEREDTTPQLNEWIKLIGPYQGSIPVFYGFFNNDYAGFAAGTCKRFMRLVGLPSNEPDLPSQGRLF